MEQLLINSQFPNASEALKAISGITDAREFAMKHWNWKRVANTNVQTWNLSEKDIKIIYKGIQNIINQTEEPIDTDVFTINIEQFHPYNKLYEEIPIDILKQANKNLLNRYS